MAIEIINLRIEKPSQPFDFYIDRRTPVGNLSILYDESERNKVCDEYQEWFDNKISNPLARYMSFKTYLKILVEAYKKYAELRFFCWCAPKRCHGETIKNYILSRR